DDDDPDDDWDDDDLDDDASESSRTRAASSPNFFLRAATWATGGDIDVADLGSLLGDMNYEDNIGAAALDDRRMFIVTSDDEAGHAIMAGADFSDVEISGLPTFSSPRTIEVFGSGVGAVAARDAFGLPAILAATQNVLFYLWMSGNSLEGWEIDNSGEAYAAGFQVSGDDPPGIELFTKSESNPSSSHRFAEGAWITSPLSPGVAARERAMPRERLMLVRPGAGIVRDARGLVWAEDFTPVQVNYLDETGWHGVDTPVPIGAYRRLKVDLQGRVLVGGSPGYSDQQGYIVFRREGGTWSTHSTFLAFPADGRGTGDFDADSAGDIHIAMALTHQQKVFHYRHAATGEWTKDLAMDWTSLTDPYPRDCAIAVAADESSVGIMCFRFVNSGKFELRGAARRGSSWVSFVPIDDGFESDSDAGVDGAAGPDGTLHFAAFRRGRLHYFRFKNGAWSSSQIPGAIGATTVFVDVDSNDRPYIAYTTGHGSAIAYQSEVGDWLARSWTAGNVFPFHLTPSSVPPPCADDDTGGDDDENDDDTSVKDETEPADDDEDSRCGCGT
ncbi:MAG: hypothetical protein KJ042_13380, partial [Deltaproteobacteria bacterium]|nr:hypothetical protein [Deltaproteobacteria bacterium]